MKIYERKAILAELKDYCFLSEDDDYVEITLWHSGDGFDVEFEDKQISLTFGEFKAIKKLLKKIL